MDVVILIVIDTS